MKIVYLIAGTFNAGGMERVLSNKANWLAAHGNDVSIITTDQRNRKPYFALDGRIKTYDLGINYDADNGHLLSKLLHYPVRQWRHQRHLTTLLKQLKADVVVCMFNNDVSFAYKIKDGSRKILEAHFSKHKKLQYGRKGLWRLADSWRTRQEEQWVQHYDRFVVLTHEDKKLWGNLPNIYVIPNARTFKPDRHAELTEKRVLAIGRLDYQKGFDRLIDIWARVKRSSSPTPPVRGEDSWRLDIVGDGPLREELQTKINQLGLQESVHILPPTSDILSLYLRSSIFVMTSRYEGLPMVLLEAQTMGLPIVAYACPCGPRDIITDGINGYLVTDDDTETFADKLLKLMRDETLRHRMGEDAVKASERFTEERIMPQWQSLLKS